VSRPHPILRQQSDGTQIAIPFYQGRNYLKQAIESVLRQSDSGWSLLVLDDGERGEAEEVIAELGLGEREDVRCLRNDRNLGMVANWNRCFDLAEEALVTLLHADDLLAPNYVAVLRGLAKQHPEASAYFCGASIIDATGRERFSLADSVKPFFAPSFLRGKEAFTLEGESALAAIMKGNFIMCPTLCFRMQKVGERRFDTQWKQVQDLAFTSRLLMDGDALVGTPSRAYAYRRHEGGATAQQSASLLRFHEELELFDRVAEACQSLGWHEAEKVSRAKNIVRLHLLYRGLGDLVTGNFDRARREFTLARSGRS